MSSQGMTVLMIAEKPSLAESIAHVLSGGKMQTRRSVACNVFEYTGQFRGKPAQFKVTSVMGHVFSIDFPKEYNNWSTVDPKDLFEAPTVKMEANQKAHVVKHLQVESKNADELVLWLDCDREGENICFEVMKVCLLQMRKPADGKPSKRQHVHRAKFSAITNVEIKRAMNKLGIPNENDAKAVDVRQELDLKDKYGNLDSALISFGPCQTPTLALCVKRHDDILSFVPKKYWTINSTVKLSTASGQSTTLKVRATRGRMFDRKKAVDVKEQLKTVKQATVTKVQIDKKSMQRPSALNTVEMLKCASTGLGMSPQHTMQVAERLYMQGYISYPRTETTKYPQSFDLRETLSMLTANPQFAIFAQDLLKNGFPWPEGGKDVGDHPPITPTRVATEYDLSGDSWRLYDFVARHFIGSISPNCKYNRTKVTVAIGKETFEVTGKVVTQPGFTSVMHWRGGKEERDYSNEIEEEVDEDGNIIEVEEDEEDDTLPLDIEKMQGQSIDVVDVGLKEAETRPPNYLTESDLIGLMEKMGIGTDASMAVHIANVCDRRYVSVQSNRRYMVPSNLGIVLIHGYQKIDPELSLPTLRAQMEKKIALIADGKAAADKILAEETAIYQKKFEVFMNKIEKMDELFEATFSPLASSGKVFSKCGKCRRYMHFMALRPVRLHCRNCNETYALPSTGSIKLFKELKCPIDNFELVLFSTGSKGKGYPICPACYNEPPFPNIESGMGCDNCPHETCIHSKTNNWVANCTVENCSGQLILDATSAPRWKLCCNKCTLVTSFNDSVHHVELFKIGDEDTKGIPEPIECEDCDDEQSRTRLINVTFGKKAERDDIKGACIFCDEAIEQILETKVIKMYGRRRGGGGRGRGRGRGRGGRGRGKKRGGRGRGRGN